MDVVGITDGDLTKQITKLTAAEWFRDKQHYFDMNPKKGALNLIDSREWDSGQNGVPGLVLPVSTTLKLPLIKIPKIAEPSMTVIVFANYATPGPHSAILQSNKKLTIEFGPDDLLVKPEK